MWLSRSRFELREEVPAAPDDVRTFYTDLANMKLVHPLVVAVDCLAGLGHRAIAYVTPTPLNPHRLSRLQGFRRAMQKHGLGEGVVITNEAMPSCTKAYEEADLSRFGHLAAHEFARLSPRPTAVIAMNGPAVCAGVPN